MKRIFNKLAVVFFFFVTFIAFAQQPAYIHLTEKDGLPDKEFYDVIEDDTGIIWLAADKGLFKYDGANYTSLTHPKQIGLSVFQLQKDSDNAIWFTNTANQLFYVKNDKITLFKNLKSQFLGSLASLIVHKDFIVLHTVHRHIIIHRITGEILYNKSIGKTKEGIRVYNSIEPIIINNKLYFGDSYNNYHEIDLTTFSTRYLKLANKNHRKATVRNTSVQIKIDNQIIYYTNYINNESKQKVFYRVPSDFSSKAIKLQSKLPDVRIVDVHEFDNQIWFSTNKGVYVCELINDELRVIRHLFRNNFVTRVIQDVNKNYWLTTLNNGVFVVPNIEINQIDIPLDKSQISTLFLGDTNELLLTSSKAKVYRYNVKNKNIDTLAFQDNERFHHIVFNHFTKEYYLYLRDYIQVFDKKLNLKNQFGDVSAVKKLCFINENTLIFAASSVIRKGSVNKFGFNQMFKNSIRGYTCLYDYKSQRSCFGTANGFFTYDENWVEKEILFQGQSIYVNTLAQTTDGLLWCSTFKNGVFVIKDEQIVAHYTTENGLLSNKNRYIRAKNNTVWLAGEEGIQKLNTETNTFSNLTKQNGLPSYSFKGFELVNDKVFVNTSTQLFSFDSEKVFQTKKILEPYITSITIDGNKQKLQTKYTLNHQQKKINIAFNSNGFLSKSNVVYDYRLLGYNDNWERVFLGLSQVNFNNLSPGNYEFQLKASNGSDVSQVKKN